MCLNNISFLKESTEKIKEHMEKVHSAKCPIENLVELCQEAEEIKERDRYDEIIKEENYRRDNREEQFKKEIKGLSGLFRGKKLMEPGKSDNMVINCILCHEKWTGSNKKQFEKHLETYHRVIFGVKEIIERGNDDWEKNSGEVTYV